MDDLLTGPRDGKSADDYLEVTITDDGPVLDADFDVLGIAELHLAFFRFADRSLVGNDAHRPSIDPRVTADDRLSVIFLELFYLRIVNDPFDDLQHIVRFKVPLGDDAIDLVRRMKRLNGFL